MKRRAFALRPVMAAVLMLAAAPLAFGLPEGAVPTFGQTTVKQTAPGRLDIVQTSERAGLDWTRFSIGAQERVVIRQPGTSSVLLNRVTGNDPSRLLGQLQANGSVWLLNPRGIVFGAQSRVDVGSLLASTLSIVGDPRAGGRVVLGQGSGAGALQADGSIHAHEGSVVLAAPDLSVRGQIAARRVGLAAATDVTVDVEGDGLVLFNVRNDGRLDTRLALLGEVRADGGSAELRAAARAGFADTVLNLEGVVRARSLGQRNGRVVIDGGADGITRVAGQVDVGGREAGQTGGSAQVLGRWVLLDEAAAIDASGRLGGGQVRVGGDWQGRNPELRNAEALMVMPGARVQADALDAGDGGRVVMWSDRTTRFHGTISALGGRDGGDGGEVEVSGKQYLVYQGEVDLRAPRGRLGDLLLDPTDITIGAGGTDTLPAPVDGTVTVNFADPDAGNSSYTATEVNRVLGLANLTLQASNDINILNNTSIGGTRQLTLEAGNDINVGTGATVRADAGLTLRANATSDGNTTGSVSLGRGASLTSSNTLTITNNGGTDRHAFATDNGTITLSGTSISVTGGADKTGSGTLVLRAPYTGSIDVQLGTLQIAGGASSGSGTFKLFDGTVLDLVGGSQLQHSLSFDAATDGARITTSSGGGTVSSAAGSLTLVDGMTLTLGAAGTNVLRVERPIAIVAGGATEALTIDDGRVNLAAATTVSGTTTVASGATLATTAANLLSNNSPLSISGALIVAGSDAVRSIGGAGTITQSTGRLTVSNGGNFTGTIDGNGGLGVSGGTLRLGQDNDYLGTTTVSSGATLQLAATGAASTTTITLASGATLDIVSGANVTNAIGVTAATSGTTTATITSSSGGGTLGAGTLTLADGTALSLGGAASPASTLTVARAINAATGAGLETLEITAGTVALQANLGIGGSTTVDSGATLTTNASNRLSSASALTVDGTLQLSNSTTVPSLAGSGTITQTAGRLTVSGGGTFSGTIGGAGGITVGGGTLRLEQANTYGLGTLVSSGATLQLADDDAAGGASISLSSGATLDIVDAASIGNTVTAVAAASGTTTTTITSSSGGGTLAAGTLTLVNGNALRLGGAGSPASTLTVQRAINAVSGGNAETLDITAGTVALQAATGITGTTTVASGATLTTNAVNLLSNSSALSIAGTLQLGNSDLVPSISGSGTLSLNAGRLTLTGSSTFSGLVSGGGGITVNAGTLELRNGSNSYGGGTTVSGGTLRVTATGAAGSGTITLADGTALELTSNATVNNAVDVNGDATIRSASGTGTLAGTLTVDDGTQLSLSGGTGTLTVQSAIPAVAGGSAETVQITGGTVVLANGTSSYTGGTTVGSGATLRLTAAGAAGTGTITLGANRLEIGGGATIANDIDTATGATLAGASGGGTLAGGTVTLDDGATLNLAGGSGGLTFSDTLSLTAGGAAESIAVLSGSVTLGSALTITGTTSVADGATLTTSADDLLSNSSALSIAGTLTLGGNDTAPSLGGAGTLALGSHQLTLSGGGTFSGTIGGAGSLKLGGGTLALSGSSTFDGGIQVDGGTLRLSADAAAGDGTITLADGTRLDITGGASIANALTAGDGARITSSSAGGTLAAGTLTLVDGGTLDLSSSGGSTLTMLRAIGPAAGAGTESVNVSAGTVSLGGAITVGGTTTVQSGATLATRTGNVLSGEAIAVDGTLQLGGNDDVGALSGSGSIALGTFALGLDAGGSFSGSIGGGTNATLRLDAGTFVLSGSSSASTTSVLGGLLRLASAERLGDGTRLVIGSSGTVELNGVETVASASISGRLSAGSAGSRLVATTTTLTGATIDSGADLGGGTLIIGAGTTTLAADSAADTLTVQSGAILQLTGAAPQLTGAPVLGVAGRLELGGDENLGAGTLTLDGGTLAGTGTLRAASYLLDGGTTVAGANLGSGRLESRGASTLGGTKSGGPLAVTDGTLTLLDASSPRLSGSPAISVSGGGTLVIDGPESAASLQLDNGTLAGSGTLTAATYALDDGTVQASLGAGTLTSDGNSAIDPSARVAAGILNVDSGVLQVRGAGLLTGTPEVEIADGARLDLQGVNLFGRTVVRGTTSGTSRIDATEVVLINGNVTVPITTTTLTSRCDGTPTCASTLRRTATATTLTVSGGTLTLDDGSSATQNGGLLAGNSSINVAAGATLVLDGPETTGTLSLSGSSSQAATLAGSGRVNATGATLANAVVGSGATIAADTLLVSANSVLRGIAAVDTLHVSGGTLTLDAGGTTPPTGGRLSGSPDIQVDRNATLTLDGAERANTLALAGTVDGSGTLTATAGYALTDGARVATALGAGTLSASGATRVEANLGASSISINSGTLTMSGARLASNADVVVGSGGRLSLDSADTIDTLTLQGRLSGNATLTASLHQLQGGTVDGGITLAGATLASTGSSTLNGSARVGAVEIDGGRLTLGSAGLLLDAPAVTIAAGAALVLGGDTTVGTLSGSGGIELGAATLTAGSGSSSRFDGEIEGDGGLVKQGSGTLTLGGASRYTGETQVAAGTLALDGAERLAAASTLDIRGGTLSLDGDQQVATLAMTGGRLSGTGSTLSADSYTLQDADVRANLGAGRLSSSGATTLTGSAAATTVTVGDGRLSLAGSQRLAGGASVTVARGAALGLQGDQTVGTLTLAGTLDGSGVLQAGRYVLQGGTASAALGSGALSSTGNSTIAGAAAVDSITVDAGSLRIAGALGASPDVTVDGGATLALPASQRFGTLAGSGDVTLAAGTTLRTGSGGASSFGGTLEGEGALQKEGNATFTFAGSGRFEGPLTVSTGTFALQGTLDTTTVNVDAGTLALTGAGRLASAAAVDVERGATLSLGNTQTVGTLQLAGTLAGSGTLTAATVTLDGAQVNANLGGGSLVSHGSSTLAGRAASGSVQVADGTLTLAASQRFSASPTLTVARGATLQLDGTDSAGTLNLQGTLAGSGTLTASRYTLDGGTAQANLGEGVLSSDGASRIDGNAAVGELSVDSGTLTLGSAGRLSAAPALAVARGATLSLGGDETVGSLALAGALASRATDTTLSVTGAAALDATTLAAGLTLDAARATATGSTTLAGTLATEQLTVQTGTLRLAEAGRLAARAAARAGGPAVEVAQGATLRLGGDESVATLEGAGRVELGSATLTAGIGGADFLFAGVIAGDGALVKQGSGDFTLTGANLYRGRTTVAAGTLQLGDGGRSGSLATSDFVVDGTLRVNRSDTLTIAQAIGGSGGVEQAGSGTLAFSGTGKDYSGATQVSDGTLAAANAGALSAASGVTVQPGARLAVVGSQQVAALSVATAGTLSIGAAGGSRSATLAADGALNLDGAVTVADNAALTLRGASIDARHAGNRWGSRLNLDSRGGVTLSAGTEGDQARELTLGSVSIAGDAATASRIEAGRLTLDGALQLGAGSLQLVASAAATPLQPEGDIVGRSTPAGRQIAFAADAVTQTAAGTLAVADGALLSVRATGGGSVTLASAANQFSGSLEVISGAPASPWNGNLVGSGSNAVSMQSRVQVAGDQVRLGGAGVEADVVRISANRLSTDAGAVIAARLPFDNLDGTAQSVPGLTLELASGAFGLQTPFGTVDFPIQVNVGSRSWGNRTDQVDAGYLVVLPLNGAQGATAVVLQGPSVVGPYDFFFEGANNQRAIPVVYNGVLPDTPQAEGSISATLAVSEGARRQGFEEAVRTENVAPRLRAGVIAEVGPGRPATVGAEGARLPASCTPAAGSLACGPGGATR